MCNDCTWTYGLLMLEFVAPAHADDYESDLGPVHDASLNIKLVSGGRIRPCL